MIEIENFISKKEATSLIKFFKKSKNFKKFRQK